MGGRGPGPAGRESVIHQTLIGRGGDGGGGHTQISGAGAGGADARRGTGGGSVRCWGVGRPAGRVRSGN